MRDISATNTHKSYFLHEHPITALVKALLNEINRLVAPLDC